MKTPFSLKTLCHPRPTQKTLVTQGVFKLYLKSFKSMFGHLETILLIKIKRDASFSTNIFCPYLSQTKLFGQRTFLLIIYR